jgi:hypothetical protein
MLPYTKEIKPTYVLREGFESCLLGFEDYRDGVRADFVSGFL